MKKVLCIVGQTATGKTSIALQLTKAIPAEIISADSRQVYIGMDIGTGKDIPADFSAFFDKGKKFFSNSQTKIWMVDQVNPDEDWSVSQFVRESKSIISKMHEQVILPLIVGGTGLYVQSLINPPESIDVPRNETLRKMLENLSIKDLQKKLLLSDANKFHSMNHSDQNNPRRLIRALEIASQKKSATHTTKQLSYDALWIGLRAADTTIEHNINKRVDERIKLGMIAETKKLIHTYSHWNSQAFSSTGYQEIRAYLEGNIPLDQAIQEWKLHELQYAKRQMTWFKKQKNIHWFDIEKQQTQQDIEKLVKNWYYSK